MSSMKIAGFRFANKTQCKGVLSWELQKRPENTIVKCAALTKLLTTLFMCRPEKTNLLENNINHWEIMPNKNGDEVAKCFAARLSDGKQVHMSYKKSVDAYWERVGVKNG